MKLMILSKLDMFFSVEVNLQAKRGVALIFSIILNK